jgi:hypothetical protein
MDHVSSFCRATWQHKQLVVPHQERAMPHSSVNELCCIEAVYPASETKQHSILLDLVVDIIELDVDVTEIKIKFPYEHAHRPNRL